MSEKETPAVDQVPQIKKKKKVDPQKRKRRKMNKIMTLVLLTMSVLTAGLLLFNTIKVASGKSSASSSGKNESMSSSTDRSMSNDYYEIGNNPTDLEKECFKELSEAYKEGTKEQKAEALAKCFVSDYFTWANKDGNYEVGGLQYIFSQKYTAFEEWSRYNYYEDMDLYLSQYGRDAMPAVTSIETTLETKRTDDFTVVNIEPEVTLPCYIVQLKWTYSMGNKMPKDNFPTEFRFLVVDHDDRMEIVEFYDMDSVRRWAEANGISMEGEE